MQEKQPRKPEQSRSIGGERAPPGHEQTKDRTLYNY